MIRVCSTLTVWFFLWFYCSNSTSSARMAFNVWPLSRTTIHIPVFPLPLKFVARMAMMLYVDEPSVHVIALRALRTSMCRGRPLRGLTFRRAASTAKSIAFSMSLRRLRYRDIRVSGGANAALRRRLRSRMTTFRSCEQ